MGEILQIYNNEYFVSVLRKWALAIAILVVAPFIRFYASPENLDIPLAVFFLFRQDLVLLIIVFGCWVLLPIFASHYVRCIHEIINKYSLFFSTSKFALPITSVILGLVCYVGHYVLLGGYANSRDEQMAVFDSQIFIQGLLVAPIDNQWQAFVPALNQMFMIQVGNQESWVSAYLPVNAAFRAMFDSIGDAALTGPFFVVTGALALWRITKQLWPDQDNLSLLSMILYAGSGQILFNGMTSYAMSGHLALNLVWLSLFLMDKKRYDIAALAIGFLATGLHQPLFHPLFAAPILSLLVLQRNWKRAFVYLIGYAAICGLWMYWPIFISSLATTRSIDSANPVDYLSRLRGAINGLNASGLLLMMLNFVRFLAWQHILLLPLIGIGFLSAWRQRYDHRNALFVAMGAGFLLPMIVMLILLPDQGLGWGYRYMHGVIGNGILLAALGWQSLNQAAVKYQILLISSAVTFFLMMPIQAYAMHSLYSPLAQIDQRMNDSKADIVLVDTDSFAFASDLVFNLPNLKDRPVRLAAVLIQNQDFVKLCAGHKTLMAIGIKQSSDLRAYWHSGTTENPMVMAAKLTAAQKAGCRIVAYQK